MTSDRIHLRDRMFVPIGSSTLEHDVWFMGRLRRAGLERPEMREGETPADFAWRVLGDAVLSGSLFELLGALIIPEGTDPLDWTPALALETADFIGGLTDPEDKDRAREVILETLLPFLRDGLASFRSSPNSSARGPGSSGSGARKTGGRGPRWWEAWRATIRRVLARSGAGRFGRRSPPAPTR